VGCQYRDISWLWKEVGQRYELLRFQEENICFAIPRSINILSDVLSLEYMLLDSLIRGRHCGIDLGVSEKGIVANGMQIGSYERASAFTEAHMGGCGFARLNERKHETVEPCTSVAYKQSLLQCCYAAVQPDVAARDKTCASGAPAAKYVLSDTVVS
jgi:hypothetical protein